MENKTGQDQGVVLAIVEAGERVARDVRILRESRRCLRELVESGHEAGINDVQLSQLAGVTRATVRDWTGRPNVAGGRSKHAQVKGQTSIT